MSLQLRWANVLFLNQTVHSETRQKATDKDGQRDSSQGSKHLAAV